MEHDSCSLLRSVALDADQKVRAPGERASGGDALYCNVTVPCAPALRVRGADT